MALDEEKETGLYNSNNNNNPAFGKEVDLSTQNDSPARTPTTNAALQPPKQNLAHPRPQRTITSDEYLVKWDGDNDPACPRSMSKLRRWIIVLICGSSSVCV